MTFSIVLFMAETGFHIKLIKSERKAVYNVTKDLFQINALLKILKNKMSVSIKI